MKVFICKNCKTELDEVIICSSGHFTCRNCGEKCDSCDGITCKACNVRKCTDCGKNICNNCFDVCSECRKSFCKGHLIKIPGTNKNTCRACMKRCSKCMAIIDPQLARKTNGNFVCTKCGNDNAIKNINKILDF